MNHDCVQPAISLTRSAAVMTGLLGGAAMIAVALGGGAPAGGSAVVCLAAYLLALAPVRWSPLPGMAFAWTIVLRMTLTLGGLMLLVRLGGMDLHETALWAACWYLMLLIVEVVLLTRHLSGGGLPVTEKPL
jgi:hypothetical protein